MTLNCNSAVIRVLVEFLLAEYPSEELLYLGIALLCLCELSACKCLSLYLYCKRLISLHECHIQTCV